MQPHRLKEPLILLLEEHFLKLFTFQIMQSIGFLGPAFFLTQLSHVDSPAMAVLCMACSQVGFPF